MEASGLMNNFPCLVIRGVSDYADFSDTPKQSFDYMLRCFLRELAVRNQSSMELLKEAYREHDKGKKEPSVSHDLTFRPYVKVNERPENRY